MPICQIALEISVWRAEESSWGSYVWPTILAIDQWLFTPFFNWILRGRGASNTEMIIHHWRWCHIQIGAETQAIYSPLHTWDQCVKQKSYRGRKCRRSHCPSKRLEDTNLWVVGKFKNDCSARRRASNNTHAHAWVDEWLRSSHSQVSGKPEFWLG